MSVAEKLAKVREKMAEEGAEHLLVSKLDDIMWLYNIRANDVETWRGLRNSHLPALPSALQSLKKSPLI